MLWASLLNQVFARFFNERLYIHSHENNKLGAIQRYKTLITPWTKIRHPSNEEMHNISSLSNGWIIHLNTKSEGQTCHVITMD